ncbi:MAG TPA: TIR domain-containing protein [Ignavibacteria bacterium]|nr:TIR domain-containing protein [Ignavibacteria bacterium]HMR41189.1 TIR domain-containing protein [Ignavibacteria bacterium]
MANYFISKVLYEKNRQLIEKVEAYRSGNKNTIIDPIEISRNTLYNDLLLGNTFSTITKDENGKWFMQDNLCIYGQFIKIRTDFSLNDNLGNIPNLLTRRKSFISYYHKDDEVYRTKFENLTSDLIINKSVKIGDINSENSSEYIKKLIQDGYLNDTSLNVVLIGSKTKCRKHVDWEISAALNYKVGSSYAGLLGLILPTHPDFGTGKGTFSLMPERLADNFKSGYSFVTDWTTDRRKIQEYIEIAFENRVKLSEKRDNSKIQMQRNTCD